MTKILSLITNPEQPVLDPALLSHIHPLVDMKTMRTLAPGCAVEFTLPDTTSNMVQEIQERLQDYPIDINLLPAGNRLKSLLIADMDSTIIEQECIDELARYAGKFTEIATITEKAMRGELNFDAALKKRVAMLGGLPLSILSETYEQCIHLTPGAKTLVRTMKKYGAYTALISGGFSVFTSRVAQEAGFDHHEANELIIQDDQLLGTVKEPILGRAAKAEALHKICREKKILPSAALAVGDGANDLDMLDIAGLGVAFRAKPATAAAAKARIHFGDLSALLYLQGIPQSDHC